MRLLGKDESVRFVNLSVYQGAPSKKTITTVVCDAIHDPQILIYLQAMVASANPILADKALRDPTLFCTGFKRQRFYLFTRSEPE